MPQLVLVDDSTTIQKIVELAFASEDVDVSSFADPAEALDHLVLEGADVVLADITLPGVDGYELCRRIRLSPRLTSVPVVLLAGTFEPFDVQLAEESGYSGSLTKPFEAAQLVALVGDLLSTSAAENGGAPPGSPAEVEGPLLFEIPVPEASEPLFELRRDQCRPRPTHLAGAASGGRPGAEAAELERVTTELLTRMTSELERVVPRLVRQVLRKKK